MLGNSGTDFGEFCGLLEAQLTITQQNCAPVPEPATLTLLGLGLAGTAAKIRQRRKKARHATQIGKMPRSQPLLFNCNCDCLLTGDDEFSRRQFPLVKLRDRHRRVPTRTAFTV